VQLVPHIYLRNPVVTPIGFVSFLRYCPDLVELTLDFSLVEEQGVHRHNWIEYISYQRLLSFNASYSRIHDAVEMVAFFV
jgi:hypothetical protein